MRAFMSEIRDRADEGFSVRQLMQSHIPEVGAEVKISAAEVTAALQKREAHARCRIPPTHGQCKKWAPPRRN